MKNMEIQDRRPFSPNVKTVSKGVFQQFVAWFKAGLGLGLMLFVALTTFSVMITGYFKRKPVLWTSKFLFSPKRDSFAQIGSVMGEQKTIWIRR